MENIRDNSTIGVANGNSSLLGSFHPSMSTRSVIAGVLVSLLAFGTLMSLGVAMGGVSLADTSAHPNAGSYGGMWVLLSVVLTLFASSYFTARVSNFAPQRIGAAQGLVVAAAFFGIILWQSVGVLSMAAGAVSQVIGGTVKIAAPAVGDAAQSAASSPVVGDLIEDSMSNLQITGDPSTVANGVASRLLRGDTEAAKAYISRHSSLTPAEIDARTADMQNRVNAALNDARQATAKALQVTGWSMFAMFVLGMIASSLGGLLGARANSRIPMAMETPARPKAYRSAYAS